MSQQNNFRDELLKKGEELAEDSCAETVIDDGTEEGRGLTQQQQLCWQFGYRAGFAAALDLLMPVIEAAELVKIQNYGLRNAWAGMWMKCDCGKLWAYGGNWNQCEPTDKCPACKLDEALERLKERVR